MRKRGVQIHLNQKVEKVLQKDGTFDGIVLEDGKIVKGDSCIIATGGLSYPSTGSTGDGYRWAEALGHKVTERSPGLVPLETKEPWVKTLQGLSLRNVNVTVLDGRKKYYEEFGYTFWREWSDCDQCQQYRRTDVEKERTYTDN